MNLKQYIREIPDFPSKGIVFKDITPLLNSPIAMEEAANALMELVGNQKIDKVVGMESRGFFFASLLALKLKAGFVPVRKPAKLPADKISITYGLEYGTDTLEIHKDAIQAGDRVLVHDDVLATGGTAKATCELVERLGGEVVQCNFLMVLELLNGEEKLNGYEIRTLMRYR
ncbi:adenine phosphoribosyltransferase [Pricia sp. S334]|uniref:Adenine phosphoribosyltransferase n=1 Tax=Pricia mediterranea TaxID=3076079 RepID=A0ABU3L1Q0_9FLAO|nr:adenine phosphoribosyltransferase [Pricia sp. S334]MDT7827647.1 adenine phosphoribosyltransferase [Pricia sp. S334]